MLSSDVLPAVCDSVRFAASWYVCAQTEGSASYDDFWAHEWTKHGTCTGMSQVEYFSIAMQMLTAVGTPDDIVGAGQHSNIGHINERLDVAIETHTVFVAQISAM